MRVFFAVDEASRIRASVLKKLLALRVSRDLYEVFPIEDSRFCCPRTDLDALFEQAMWEGEKILNHYPDASTAIVIIGAAGTTQAFPIKTVPLEYAVIVRPHVTTRWRLLNPRSQEGRYWATSPNLQPELTEKVIELSELEPSW
jgi:hypothetical protein